MAPPWQKRAYDREPNSLRHLSLELLDLTAFLSSKAEEDAARTAVFSQVSSVIKKCFPDCVVELYGSSATQLCLPNSDLDLSVSGTGGSGAPWSDLAPFLREFGAQNLQVISTSKVPLVKLRDPVYSLNVDISFQTNSAAPSVELVRTWMTQMDRFKPLVLAVKYFLLQRDLNVPYSGGLSSFVVACMVRHFLSSIRGNRKSGSNARRKLTDMSPLGPLLLGFLRYFGSRFNFTNLVYFTDGTTRRKSECGLSEGPMFVMANPLENSLVNCAASAFRIAEVATTFAVLEQQLSDAAALDLKSSGSSFETVLSAVVFADPMIEERRKLFRELRSLHRPFPPLVERSESGKAPRKALKIDVENNGPNNNV